MTTPGKNIIISPSGNFYGSEQVLFDFLKKSNENYQVYVPSKSLFENKLKHESKHQIKTFKRLSLLYAKLLVTLFIKNYSIYINEGGHVKYIKQLARLLPNRKFVLQIRLLADTDHTRLKDLPSNIQVVCVSRFIANNIPNKFKPLVLHDPFELPQPIDKRNHSEFNIGFIGRVTPTKGLKEASILLNQLETKNMNVNIHFFGSVETDKEQVNQFVSDCQNYKNINVEFKGFIDNKTEIYKNLNLVIHLNKEEAFPRIALESWSFGIPLIGFDAGGLGEINKMLDVKEFLVEDNDSWLAQIMELIKKIHLQFPNSEIAKAQEIIKHKLDLNDFTQKLEEIIG